ncbi:DgyrCDS2760 [Dimorphilus gyrociliatus]|uniref:DgyrCDS2760 n=1 Tax=Dimorphilus gyrociliatus TaxID=2664684 RepID=A0A7I8VGD0_9ANNE|nr:DgyrCDS2760 [Dimorphilus gyrociliatus]
MPTETSAIRVIAKCRPTIKNEQNKAGKKITKIQGDKLSLDVPGKDQTFSFDKVYGADVKNTQIFREECDSLAQRLLNGYNISLLAVGATGSGKSHLMNGTELDQGIIPQMIKSVNNEMANQRNQKQFFSTISYVEILNEELTDLLNPHDDEMCIREHNQLGIYVERLSELICKEEDDMMSYYEQGNRARKMGTNDIHNHRAKANGIVIIQIEQKDLKSTGKLGVKSKLVIADMAGIEGAFNKKDKDKSIETFVSVVTAGKQGGNNPKGNSKLTKILSDAIGGNSICYTFLTLSQMDSDYLNTQHTLSVGQTLKSIKNKFKINLNETSSVINDLREEIAKLREKISKNPDNCKEDVARMQQLIQDLKTAKQQNWDEKEKLSERYSKERQKNLANKGVLDWVLDTSSNKGNKEKQERALLLQKEKDQLTLEYKERRRAVDDLKNDLQMKVSEHSQYSESGKVNSNENKKKISIIHETKEKLKAESEALKDVKKRLKEVQDDLKTTDDDASVYIVAKGDLESRIKVQEIERRRLEDNHKAHLDDETEKIRMEIEQRKMEIKNYTTEDGIRLEQELVGLKSEKHLVSLRIQHLQEEKLKIEQDLHQMQKRQKEEFELQQLQHFQAFRKYREIYDKQKAVIEERFRKLLEDSVQDAIFLSVRNEELMGENNKLRQEIAQLKDQASVRPNSSNKSK